MALHDLGYRAWSGPLAPAWTRWAVIAGTSIRSGWRSRWVRRLMFVACFPAFWYAVGFFAFEQSIQRPEWQSMAIELIELLDPPDRLMQTLRSGSSVDARHAVWSLLLNSYVRNPQAVVMVLLVGLLAPPLISQDVRSRAFLLYFSRPLGRSEYLLGKSAAVWAYLMLISAVPALLLYLMGVLLSPRVEVLTATWDLPFRILLASTILAVPTTSLALMFSSLTQESRYAAFAWFVVWVFGWLTYSILQLVEAEMTRRDPFDLPESQWSLLSLFHVLGRVQKWAFGFAPFQDVAAPALILIVITVVSLAVLFRRVSAPMRA